MLFSEEQAGNGDIENTHQPNPDMIAVFADTILYVNIEECTSCTACYQPDVCPVGAIYSDEHVPDGPSQHEVQQQRPEQGSRPHVLHPAEPRRLRRLVRRISNDERRARLGVRHHLASAARVTDVTKLAG